MPPQGRVAPTNYSELSKAELQTLLDEKEITYKAADNKDKLIKLLQGE